MALTVEQFNLITKPSYESELAQAQAKAAVLIKQIKLAQDTIKNYENAIADYRKQLSEIVIPTALDFTAITGETVAK